MSAADADRRSDPTAEPRTVVLEEKVSYLERHLTELDGVVRDMHGRMDAAARELVRLKDLVKQMNRADENAAGAGGTTPDDDELTQERPPHW